MDDIKDTRRADESKVDKDKNSNVDKERKAEGHTCDKINKDTDALGDGMEAGNKSQAEGVRYDV
ncbi:MAG TPA: hypothetical protein V6D22_22635 [Candidatus Obscuribacterales bacterium]